VLLALGAAYALLAVTYLAAQYLLGLRRRAFAAVLAVAAVLEPVLLLVAADDLGSFAAIVLGIQAATAAALLVVALRGRHHAGPDPASPAPLRALDSD
jgi:hypothetical protein